MTENKKDEIMHAKVNPGTMNQPPVDEFIFRNKETPPTRDNFESHETIILNSLEKESKLDVPNTKFTKFTVLSTNANESMETKRSGEIKTN